MLRCYGRRTPRVTPCRLTPAAEQVVLDVELVERFADRMRDDVVDGSRLRVHGRNRRQNNGPDFGKRTRVRRWPRCSGVSRTTRTSLRRSLRQTSAARTSRFAIERIGDRGGAFHRTRDDDHPGRQKRTRRDRGREVVVAVHDMRQRFEIRCRRFGFERDRAPCLPRDDQMRFAVRMLHAARAGRRTHSAAACSGDADDDPTHRPSGFTGG